jgi:hypothetical protein
MCNFSASFCAPSLYNQANYYSNQTFIGAVTTIGSQKTVLITGLPLNATGLPLM